MIRGPPEAGAPRTRRARVDLPPAPPRRHARALRLAGLAVVLGSAALGLRTVDLAALRDRLEGASPALLAIAALANIGSLAAHSGRWRAIVHAAARVRFRDVFAALVAGFAVGLAAPARAGDLVRSHLVARRAGLPTSTVVATAAVDYLVGGAVLVPLIALLALAAPLPRWAANALRAAVIVAVVGGVAVWALRPREGAEDGKGLAGLVARLRRGLEAARDPGALARSAAWAVAGWGAELGIALFALAAFGLPVTIEAGALAVLATTAAAFVSVSPGNAGPFEIAVVVALAGLGVPREAALAFALGYHLVHVVPTAIVGALALAREARA
jgi:uncharacterized membrane protein YbhN (UPF0104 family)